MAKIRLIPRLDIKGPNLIKGIHLEGLRVMGDPQIFAARYYEAGADELLYMDVVASLYGRNSLTEIVRHTARNLFIPMTVGGGLRSVDDVKEMLRCGADKTAINTAAVQRPQLITEVAQRFGNQCMVLSLEAKQIAPEKWEAYTDNGREPTGRDVVEWAQQAQALGAGEILLTSVDREGTGRGFDLPLLKAVSAAVEIPVVASGGMGTLEHVIEAHNVGGVDAVAMAGVLHYAQINLREIREGCLSKGLDVRQFDFSESTMQEFQPFSSPAIEFKNHD